MPPTKTSSPSSEPLTKTKTPPPTSEPITRTTTPDAKSTLSSSFGFRLPAAVPKGPTKDLAYYRESGDCTILVGNILFKLHKFLLVKDSVEFQKKFDEAGKENRKGSTDEDAIVLDDDVTAFQHLCWVLYANLHELSQITDASLLGEPPLSRTQKLCSIASIAHKYKMTGIQDWAIKAISDICMKTENLKGPPKGFTARHSLEVLKYFTIAADVSQNVEMLTRAKNTWLSRIEDGELIAQEALNLAEERRWREFQGRIYLAVLRRLASRRPSNTEIFKFDRSEDKAVSTSQPLPAKILDIVCDPGSSNRPFGSNTATMMSLSTEHRARLFEGHWILTKVQREFYGIEKAYVPFAGPMSTMTKLETAIWEELWEECLKLTIRQQQTGLIHDDPLAMLAKMQEFIKEARDAPRDGHLRELGKLADYAVLLKPSLFKDIDALFINLKKKLIESLPGYFSVPQ
ncbi:hypothetical protein AGABI2DRAFT_179459 [Agaricus bisporus var. bisporus H97]|uniref:hypothetical protein n=1 Tax=Agaricus bisporus var. bisporus (strain H97 / ATCC MYA-4626 / FGSC 10389) TaxID=936046 RepID=UPI00029F56D8|nr:hypothetical protein AGABI2DRAFT_179459 [Agaricus bisporus var. bisporus H97]EKV46035.1 hypothetical protein AGABI2DRAFT_179459 [Agaricus bisporus var. bisporus H97]